MRKDEQPITSKGRKNPRDRIYHEYDLYLRSMNAGLQLKIEVKSNQNIINGLFGGEGGSVTGS